MAFRCRPRGPRQLVFCVCAGLLFIAIFSMMYLNDGGKSVGSSLWSKRKDFGEISRHIDPVLDDNWEKVYKLDKGAARSLTKEGRELPVVIVEEHHEVLPYWFSGVEKGIVKRKGNVLIHIDGHSDAAPPVFFEGYPKSFYPRNAEELRVLIQRNDAFILEAIYTGLISRLIWIWPTWDQENHEVNHESANMLLGVADIVYKEYENSHIKVGCLCEADNNNKPSNCTFLNVTSDNTKDGDSLDPKLCNIKTSLILEDIREDIALEMALNGSLYKGFDKNHLLLDIDEDFYGCESVIEPILDDTLTMKSIDFISAKINRLFRPEATVMETAIDSFMGDFLTGLIQAKDCGQTNPPCENNLRVHIEKFNSAVTDLTILPQSGFRSKRSSGRLKIWTSLTKHLETLTLEQLKYLKEVGFCFQTTPKSYDFDPEDNEHFRVCHGTNTPGRGIVNYHTPNEMENEKRTNLLQNILESTNKYSQPSLVTVCRSMRDGYTPRKYFHNIENDVLISLKRAFSSTLIHYDSDLLGGQYGWPSRHTNRD